MAIVRATRTSNHFASVICIGEPFGVYCVLNGLHHVMCVRFGPKCETHYFPIYVKVIGIQVSSFETTHKKNRFELFLLIYLRLKTTITTTTINCR